MNAKAIAVPAIIARDKGALMKFTVVMTMAMVLDAAPAFAQAARGGGFEVRAFDMII